MSLRLTWQQNQFPPAGLSESCIAELSIRQMLIIRSTLRQCYREKCEVDLRIVIVFSSFTTDGVFGQIKEI